MPQFFIDRPIFAWVVAIFIMLAGVIAIPFLPIAQYPNVAPPQISDHATYPGASREDIYQSVTRPIEEELNGVDGPALFRIDLGFARASVNINGDLRSRAPIRRRRPSTCRTASAASSRACRDRQAAGHPGRGSRHRLPDDRSR